MAIRSPIAPGPFADRAAITVAVPLVPDRQTDRSAIKEARLAPLLGRSDRAAIKAAIRGVDIRCSDRPEVSTTNLAMSEPRTAGRTSPPTYCQRKKRAEIPKQATVQPARTTKQNHSGENAAPLTMIWRSASDR